MQWWALSRDNAHSLYWAVTSRGIGESVPVHMRLYRNYILQMRFVLWISGRGACCRSLTVG